MMNGAARSFALACAYVVTCAASVADAQNALDRPTDPAAVAHYEKGNAYYGVRDFAKAIDEYKAGALIQKAARFDFNLAQCYRMLGQYDDSIWHYGRYLHSGFASAQDADQIKKWIDMMNAEKEQRARSAPPTEAAPLRQGPLLPPSLPTPEPPHADPWYRDYFAWVLAGSGLVVGGVGIGLEIDASSLRNQANATANQQQQISLRNTADSRELAGTILAIGGGALLVTGIVKLVIHDHDPAAVSAISLSVSPSGVFVFGRF